MKNPFSRALPAVASLAAVALAVSACGNGASTPSSAADAAAAPATTDAAAAPAAQPAADQPAQDVPPAKIDEPAATPMPGSADPPSPDSGLARIDGYGDMRFGMTTDAATKAWGGELKGTTDQREGCHFLTPKWVKTPRDFAFMFEGDKFVRYDVGTAKEAAPGGGKVGMGAEEIGKLYAGRVEEAPHKYVEGAKTLSVKDAGGGDGKLVFETDAAGKITRWRAGTPPQVDYVEGCG